MAYAVVKYQVATYSGTIEVDCDPSDDNEDIKARAKGKLNRLYGPLPFGYESYRILEIHE